MKKRIGILTGGGDVQPLNAVIASARDTAKSLKIELVGIIKGWEGALESNYTDLSTLSIDPTIGGTILKSSRVNISKIKNGSEIVIDNLKKNNISGLIVIGGDDTLSNSFLIKSFPQILISKTIDNDIGIISDNHKKFKLENIINYFTLGFPTAASKISSFVSLKDGLRTTAYSHERIIVVESMGMHTGWLALSSGMGFPDFIIIPEFPLNYDSFLEKVIEKYNSQKHLIIVIAEGAKWKNGSFIYTEKDESEDFGHPRFGGSSNALKIQLKKDLAKHFNTRNINAVNPSYLYRSGKPNKLDLFWAQRLGETAVRYLVEGIKGAKFLAINKDKSGFIMQNTSLSDFNSINELYRLVDNRFYEPKNFQITEDGKRYFREIIIEFPLDKSYELIGSKHHKSSD
ncbi:MAG: 6-phosphofructokinase [Candidatus Aminicenantes bacterium]|nr:6-phosphofructokinase [Candidatus Aminicenantes bacterium]